LGNTVIAQKRITVYGHPTASFDIAPREVYIPGQHISCYNYSTHADTSYWNFGDGREIVVRFAPTYTYQDTGVFDITLTIVNSYGCTDSITVEDAVHVIKRSGFFFPKPLPLTQAEVMEAIIRNNPTRAPMMYFTPLLLMGKLPIMN
jgi:PKD repeat protein